MQFLMRGRQMGKTTELIELAAKTGSYILTFNRERVRRIYEQAENIRLNIRQPVSVDEMIRGDYHTGYVKNLVIDDAEIVLQHLFRRNEILAISMTVEVKAADLELKGIDDEFLGAMLSQAEAKYPGDKARQEGFMVGAAASAGWFQRELQGFSSMKERLDRLTTLRVQKPESTDIR